jgi:hypothetical protein
MIVGKDIKERFFLKITLIRKINKQKKHMIIVKEKWMKEEQNKDNKKPKHKWRNIKIQTFLSMKNLKI